jgi:hypothetical protein
MSWLIRQGTFGLTCAALLGLSQPAHAQVDIYLSSIPTAGTVSQGYTATIGSWSLYFEPLSQGSCTYTHGGGSSCGNIEIIASVHRGSLGLTIEEAAGPSAALLSNSKTSIASLALDFTVTAPTGKTVSAASLSYTGTGQSADLMKISDIAKADGNSLPTTTANSAAVSAAFSPVVNTFSVSNKFQIASGVTTGTLALNTVMQLYTSAPEPVSLSLLAVGLAGLAAAKRRRQPV